jgi:hypothetical protein
MAFLEKGPNPDLLINIFQDIPGLGGKGMTAAFGQIRPSGEAVKNQVNPHQDSDKN